MDPVAVYAAVVSTGALGFGAWSYRNDNRTRVRVTVEMDEFVIGQGNVALTVVARNRGRSGQAVREALIEFFDDTGTLQFPRSEMRERVDQALESNWPATWTRSLPSGGEVGRFYRGTVQLGTGEVVRSQWYEFNGAVLSAAGAEALVVDARPEAIPSAATEPLGYSDATAWR
jgi:hypothetical protein